jgi:hypothetical protein
MRAVVCLVALAACGGGAGGSLSGSQAFGVTSAYMLPAAYGCSNSQLPSGQLDAMTVVLGDADLAPIACMDSQTTAVPHVMILSVASAGSLTADPATANDPLVSGDNYPILDEGVTDEDLCGNVPANTNHAVAIAMTESCPTGQCGTSYWATAGAIALTSSSPTHVAGTISITLGNGAGGSADDGGALSGNFDADVCP